MSIEIKNLAQAHARASNEGRGVAENRNGPVPDGSASQGRSSGADRVTLTNSLSDLAQTASEQPAVDSKKVNEIRQAIQEGRYEVSPERIAAGLIRMEGL